MEALWKWLMHLNAKRVCIVSALVFIGMVSWRAVIEFNPPRPPSRPSSGHVKKRTFQSLGIFAFLKRQLAPEQGIVPVSPFRPPAEALPTNKVVKGSMVVTVHQPPTNTTKKATTSKNGPPPENDPENKPENKPWAALEDQDPKTPPRRDVVIYYRGMLQRPDGTILAWISSFKNRYRRFVNEGSFLFGCRIIKVGKKEISVRLPDGEERTISLNESITIKGALKGRRRRGNRRK